MNFLNLIKSFGGEISIPLAMPPTKSYIKWAEGKGPPYVMFNGPANEVEYLRINKSTEDITDQTDSVKIKGEFEASEDDLTSAWDEANARGLQAAPADKLGRADELFQAMGAPLPSASASIVSAGTGTDASSTRVDEHESVSQSSGGSHGERSGPGGKVASAAVAIGLKEIKAAIHVKKEPGVDHLEKKKDTSTDKVKLEPRADDANQKPGPRMRYHL